MPPPPSAHRDVLPRRAASVRTMKPRPLERPLLPRDQGDIQRVVSVAMDSLGLRGNERDMQPYQREMTALAYQVLRALCFDTLAGRPHRVSDVLRFARDGTFRAAVLERVDDPDVL